ncbi:MAG: S41 family peptidase [Tissierellia bacterium]|nr:S41 family peptidase [Tissierellia bacterium]
MKKQSRKTLLLLMLLLVLAACSPKADTVTLSGADYQEYTDNVERMKELESLLSDKTKEDGSVTISRDEYEQYKLSTIKIERLEETLNQSKSVTQTDTKILERVDYLKKQIENNYLFEYDETRLEEGIYKGLFQSLDDPYSVYYNEKEFKDLMEESSGLYGGIGVVITAMEGDYITVVSPIEGTPGERAGILPGDRIILVDGEAYFATDMDKALEHMRGEPNTDVTLTLRRDKTGGGTEDIEVTLTREMIKIISVKDEALEDGLGYIQISSFDENTANDFSAALKRQTDSGVKGIVLDLRNNPGGLLDQCLRIADELLPAGNIVSIVDKYGEREENLSGSSYNDIPMVVLVNKGSASASEILSGALKDHERASVIGTQTFGKGIVQRIFPIEGGGFKLTVSQYYTPDDIKIHEVGVTPDQVVELPAVDTPIGPDNLTEDLQLQKAIELLK